MNTFVIRYHGEGLSNLLKCMNSIKKQPRAEFEFFLVGEYTEEIKKELENRYKKGEVFFVKDNRIDLETVKTIVNKAKGAYIQFLDERDYVTIDWCYGVSCANGADYILGNQIYRKDRMFEYNLSVSKYLSDTTTKSELLSIYYNHGGEDRYLKEITNKVISINLIKRALDYVAGAEIQMEETLLLQIINLVCIMLSEKIYYMKVGNCIYEQKKEISFWGRDYQEVIDKFEIFINQIERLAQKNNVKLSVEWKKDWYREVINTLYLYNPTELIGIIRSAQEKMGEYFNPTNSTSYHEKLTTELSDNFSYYMDIKEHIASSKCHMVGFDIFDTLIERPFWEPTDLFKLLNHEFNRLVGKGTVIDFSLIRQNGEQGCRAYYIALRPFNEDVTIGEIYDYISYEYGIDKNVTDALKEYEISLEKKYCVSRKIGKELYNWAKYCGKSIYIISDMYLPKKVIEDILAKNNYIDYEKLYLSNDLGISKYSGKLFDYFIQDQEIDDAASVCFIGDNYGVDVCNSQRCNMVSFHVPKATEVFKGDNKAIYAGEIFKNIYCPNGGIIDQGTALKFLGIRCMLAVVANKFFGNPFVSFNQTSDFNADGRFIGYYCAGMFLYSEAEWLIKESINKDIEKIHFVARDGYFIKKVYDKIKRFYPNSADSNYLYFSRKAVAPLYMQNPEGIYELYLPPHILANTPMSVIKFLGVVEKDGINCEEILKKQKIVPFKKFSSMNEFYIFAKVFIDNIYDADKARNYKNMLKKYYEKIVGKKDAIFDVGYSGRLETALTKLLGYPINSYYFHEHEPWALDRKAEIGFTIDSFYSFKPCSAFVLREQIFTPNQPSCIGFKQMGNSIEPEFGLYKASYKETLILENIQKWALKFTDDMIEIFGADLQRLTYNRFDACIPLEYYMHYAKRFDKAIMSAIDFEDEFGTNEILSICDYWEKEQQTYMLNIKGKENVDGKDNSLPVNLKKELRQEIYCEEGIFSDGLFMKMYKSINKKYPFGSRKREIIKKILKIFIK